MIVVSVRETGVSVDINFDVNRNDSNTTDQTSLQNECYKCLPFVQEEISNPFDACNCNPVSVSKYLSM